MTNNTPDYDNLYFEPKAKGTLTEQWKQKKLPLGWYFVKDGDGKIYYAEYMEWFNADGWCGNYFECEEKIVEVLAEAPDYIEWQNMVNCACEEHKANTELLEENAEIKERNESLNNRDINLCRIANDIRDENFALKELLKECKEYIENVPVEDKSKYMVNALNLLRNIDEVLNA